MGAGGGGGAQGRPGACNANGLAQAEQTLFQHNHSSQSKGLWGAEMRQDREQKNVIYKASADWNLSSDPLAAAQLICSWFQTTPPGRPEGTFFRFYAWIYLFNSPFTKTTADDSTNQSLWRKRRTHTLSLTHTRTPGTQASENLRHHLCSAQACSAQEALGRKNGGANGQRGEPMWPHRENDVLKAGVTAPAWVITPPRSSSGWPGAVSTLPSLEPDSP